MKKYIVVYQLKKAHGHSQHKIAIYVYANNSTAAKNKARKEVSSRYSFTSVKRA